MTFNSRIFILPGLGNSGPEHWQSLWEKENPAFERINQGDWETPVCSDWIDTIEKKIAQYPNKSIILVAHSLACSTVCFWAEKYKRAIKGALLVAPSDTEADTYPEGTTGFVPVPLIKLPFRSIVVMSTNDYYVTPERATLFAKTWGSELVSIGDAGHINVAAGFGKWDFGLELLKRLDS